MARCIAHETKLGRAVDQRSDVRAFGCVLFEMLTGYRAFAGDDVSGTHAFVITREPEWSLLAPETPSSIRRLLRRCLQKDSRRRLAAITDARLELDDATGSKDVDGDSIPKASTRAPVGSWGSVAAASLAVALWLGTFVLSNRSAGEAHVYRSSLLLPGSLFPSPGTALALSRSIISERVTARW